MTGLPPQPALPELKGLQAVVFDLDGTLVDTLGDFEQALNRTLADLDLPPVPRELLLHTIGKGSEHLIRSVLAHQLGQVPTPEQQPAHAPEPEQTPAQTLRQASEKNSEQTSPTATCTGRSVQTLYPAAWQRYQHHYRLINGQHAQVYPGVLETLQHLQQTGLHMACLTNKPLAFARELLQRKALLGYFSVVFGGDSFERKKPDPLPLLKTCEALGSALAHTLMVGDSSNDAQAAHSAGCPVVLVSYGYNHGQDIRRTPALAWLDALPDLLGILALRPN